tara:strand:- start:740 stop:1321 length:582 start_codon:yes stop_codon:yes gene_type:complete
VATKNTDTTNPNSRIKPATAEEVLGKNTTARMGSPLIDENGHRKTPDGKIFINLSNRNKCHVIDNVYGKLESIQSISRKLAKEYAYRNGMKWFLPTYQRIAQVIEVGRREGLLDQLFLAGFAGKGRNSICANQKIGSFNDCEVFIQLRGFKHINDLMLDNMEVVSGRSIKCSPKGKTRKLSILNKIGKWLWEL